MRQNQWAVTATVDGEPLGVFDKCSGGTGDSEELKYRPGAMGPQRSYGGPATIENVTIERVLEQVERDDVSLARRMYAKRGRASMVVTKQALDADGNPFGRPFVYTGKLKTCTIPDADSEATGLAIWSLVLSTEGDVA